MEKNAKYFFDLRKIISHGWNATVVLASKYGKQTVHQFGKAPYELPILRAGGGTKGTPGIDAGGGATGTIGL